MRDRWNEDGVRLVAGTHVDFPVDQAMDGVENGSLSRVKEAPKKAK